MKKLIFAVAVFAISITAYSGFTGVTLNNKARGPVEVIVRCFLDHSSSSHHVLAHDEPAKDISMICPE